MRFKKQKFLGFFCNIVIVINLLTFTSTSLLVFDMELKHIKNDHIYGKNDFSSTLSSSSNVISKHILPGGISTTEIFTLKIALGTPEQYFDVIYDTRGYHLWLTSEEFQGCVNCKIFDFTKSSTFQKTDFRRTIKHDDYSILGFEVSDKINILDKKFRFDWFLADYVNLRLNDADGVIGFARNFTPVEGNSFVSTKFSMLDALFNQNIIEKQVFSQVFTDADHTKAKFYIGEYPEFFSDSSNYSVCNVIKSEHFLAKTTLKNLWTCRLSYILIGDAKSDDFDNISHKLNSRAVFDSVSNFISAPYEVLEIIQTSFNIFEHCIIEFDTDTGVESILCPKEFDVSLAPEMSIIFNGFAYTIPSSKLFREFIVNGQKRLAFVINFSKQLDYWIIGQYFMRNFNMLFDKDRNVIGFNGEKEYIRDFSKFTTDDDFYLSEHLSIIILSAIIALFIIGSITFMCVFYMKRKRDQLAKNQRRKSSKTGIINESGNYHRLQ